jgi:hypothetical protein
LRLPPRRAPRRGLKRTRSDELSPHSPWPSFRRDISNARTSVLRYTAAINSFRTKQEQCQSPECRAERSTPGRRRGTSEKLLPPTGRRWRPGFCRSAEGILVASNCPLTTAQATITFLRRPSGNERPQIQARTMATEPSSQAIEPSPQIAERPPAISRRAATIAVVWFFGWPILVFLIFASAPLIQGSGMLYFFLLVPGTVLWFGSCIGIYELLFASAEARWPAAKTVREILSPLLRMLLSRHHSS